MDPTEHRDRKLAAGILRLPVKINKGAVVSEKLISTVFNEIALATYRDSPNRHTYAGTQKINVQETMYNDTVGAELGTSQIIH